MQKLPDQSDAPGGPSPRGRGRPRSFDREAALAQATRLFWTRGYEATSISDLTEAMGIGSPSLYAAFGSKEALYAEALRHYGENFEPLFWIGFETAPTARGAVEALLLDSAALLGGCRADVPPCCMVTIASIGSEGHENLETMLRDARACAYNRIRERLQRAVAEGELPASVDVAGLARFVQSVQSGMSLLGRDGVPRADLEAVAQVTMTAYDAWVAGDGSAASGS